MKIRNGKKYHINFPYSSVEPERTQQALYIIKIGGAKG